MRRRFLHLCLVWIAASPALADPPRGADFHGADDDLDPTPVPTADPDPCGGDRLDALVGLSWHGSEGRLAGHRFAFEVGWPFHQDLDGPQLETDWVLSLLRRTKTR